MALATNSTSAVPYEWEYYYDYLDPVFVDESKLTYNKYLVVITCWIVLIAFVGFLFLSLNLMSCSRNLLRLADIMLNCQYLFETEVTLQWLMADFHVLLYSQQCLTGLHDAL
uniref:Melanocortin 2 receptor accessory protein n=1 Tax=Anabas testudineus TaxID=64144 RepID=A0A3Q1JPX5_ANATE